MLASHCRPSTTTADTERLVSVQFLRRCLRYVAGRVSPSCCRLRVHPAKLPVFRSCGQNQQTRCHRRSLQDQDESGPRRRCRDRGPWNSPQSPSCPVQSHLQWRAPPVDVCNLPADVSLELRPPLQRSSVHPSQLGSANRSQELGAQPLPPSHPCYCYFYYHFYQVHFYYHFN